MEYVLTGSEMADCDRRTSEEIGIPSLVLMERAALSVADGVDAYLRRGGGSRPVVLAAAGRGNNGADALAAGRILLDRGYDVRFCRLSGDISPGSSFAVQERILKNYGLSVPTFAECAEKFFFMDQEASGDCGLSGPANIPSVIIDGLFGTGLSRPLRGEAAEFVSAINRLRKRAGAYVVAVDLPSGISSEDGSVMGCAVRCDETRTFAFYKRGHFLYPGTVYAGKLELAEIGITERAFRARPGMFTFLTESPASLLPARDPGGNKGTFGKILIVAGRRNMCGAALLAARACMAAGAGMVKVFTHEANRLIIQQALPEAMLDTFREDESPAQAAERLRASLDWADVAAAGPAMGTDETARALLAAVLDAAASGPGADAGAAEHGRVPNLPESALVPDSTEEKTDPSAGQRDPDSVRGPERGSRRVLRGLVLDADALRILAVDPDLRERLAGRDSRIPCILTPHMAEFAALAGVSMKACLEDRVSLVQEQAGKLCCTIACKDARTLVASYAMPSGMYLNCSGNSGMASAGSGDVLTGIAAALLARSGSFAQTDCPEERGNPVSPGPVPGRENAASPGAPSDVPLCSVPCRVSGEKRMRFSDVDVTTGFAAACCAVYLHGCAGDCARAEHGEAAMTAGDLIEALRRPSFRTCGR